MAKQYPEPVMSLAVEPVTKADHARIANALARFADDDPSFRTADDVATGRIIIFGMGEVHLDGIVARLLRQLNVEAKIGRPRVAYKETIRRRVREEGRYVRKSSAGGEYGSVVLEMEPRGLSKGFEFVNALSIQRGLVSPQFVEAVEAGVRESLNAGPLAGYPVVDIKATLVGGAFDRVDATKMHFHVAASLAMHSGYKKADPIILEPIMNCEVLIKFEQHLADIVGDLNSRRARIVEMGDRGQMKFLKCAVPLSEMFGYSNILRSISAGSGSFTLAPSHFEEAPWDTFKASIDPHGSDEPPSASAGRPVRPVRPRPGLSGGGSRPLPPETD